MWLKFLMFYISLLFGIGGVAILGMGL